MRWVVVAVLCLTPQVWGCGRYGYDYLSRGDQVGGSADGGDGDGTPGDGDGDVGAGDGDSPPGDGDGTDGPPDLLDGAAGGDGDEDGDGGVAEPSDGGGTPNPSLAACPAPIDHDAPLPRHRYEFARTDSLAQDSISMRNGSLTGATQAAGLAELSGTGGSYVQLPSGLLSALSRATIVMWVRWDSGPQNQTLFDFGQSSSNRLQLLASSPGYGVTANFATASTAFTLRTTRYLTIGSVHQVVVELDPQNQRAVLSIDGNPESTVTGVTFSLADLRDDNMWIGRSNGSEQPFKGGIEELRIYESALGVCGVLGSSRAGFASTTFARCADPQSSCGFASTTAGVLWACDEAVDFATAASRCASAGMQLARANDATENQLLTTVSSQQVVWIGLNDQKAENSFAWCDGSQPSYLNWAPDEPNDNTSQEDCASLNKPDGQWNDLRCTELHGFLCEP